MKSNKVITCASTYNSVAPSRFVSRSCVRMATSATSEVCATRLLSITVIHVKYYYLFQTAAEWNTVFVITAAIYLVGAVIYGLFASGELQPWAKKPKNENAISLLKVIPNTHMKVPVE